MSAGTSSAYPGEPPLHVSADLARLAPAMRAAVTRTLADCRTRGIDAVVYEGYRARETAVAYYKRGRTQVPPQGIVTSAPDETYSWHGYGLAVDIISASKGWKVGHTWHAMVAELARPHGLKWGGDWTRPDLPHHQWGRCKASPSELARTILRGQGLAAVWRAVGADRA